MRPKNNTKFSTTKLPLCIHKTYTQIQKIVKARFLRWFKISNIQIRRRFVIVNSILT